MNLKMIFFTDLCHCQADRVIIPKLYVYVCFTGLNRVEEMSFMNEVFAISFYFHIFSASQLSCQNGFFEEDNLFSRFLPELRIEDMFA